MLSDNEMEFSDNSSDDSSGSSAASARRNLDFSDSEDEFENAMSALSPRTLLSITGLRSQDLDDDDEDSSEIDYSDDDDNQEYNYNSHDDDDNDDNDNSDDDDEDGNEDEEQPSSADGDETFFEEPEHQEEAATSRYRQSFNYNMSRRNSSAFLVPKVEDTFSSTLLPPSSLGNYQHSQLEISSDNKDNIIGRGRKSRDLSPRNVPSKPKTSNLVQPTKKSSMRKSSGNVQAHPKGGGLYEKETQKLNDMHVQLTKAIMQYEMVYKKRPEKAAQLQNRIDGLNRDIDIKMKSLAKMKNSQEQPLAPTKLSKSRVKKSSEDVPDWEQLSAEVDRIKPSHKGAQGMATFNAQKALTLDTLRNLHSSLKSCPKAQVLAADPPGLKVKLMDHQKHALAWLTWREQQRPRGGILADDMGLGKTLTMISLVAATRNQNVLAGESSDEDEPDINVGKKRKSVGGKKSKASLKNSIRGGTLVVCPASLLRQWEAEVTSKMSRPRLKVCVHHGTNRTSSPEELANYDMVITTYNLVSRDDKKTGSLNGIHWRRIILDEAHVVRNHKAQSSVAVSSLRGRFRWALTGTPIHNKELDVFALLKFLRCSPFDDMATWKTWIDNKSSDGQGRLNLVIKSLMLRRTKAQLQAAGKLNSLPQKEIRLIELTLDTDEMNVYQRVMTYSRSLFAQFLFQRAEKDSDANYVVGSRKPTYKQIKDPNGAYYKMHEMFANMAGQSKEVRSHEILVLLLRLRQICCHPGLIDSMLEDGHGHTDFGGSDSRKPEVDLLAQLNKMSINERGGGSSRRSGVSEARLAKVSQNVLKRGNPVFNLKRPSSKMLKVLEILRSQVLRTRNDKAVVVSQWTSVLDILRNILHKEKLATLSLNGAIAVKDRQTIVNEFNDPKSSKRILLLSLTAGGVGLNLVGGNHLILMDLHWNPQLESQAQDRIYRVGQQKNVVIYKMVCLDTVEQRIKALQERKLELADDVLCGKVGSKLSIDDLRGLFGL